MIDPSRVSLPAAVVEYCHAAGMGDIGQVEPVTGGMISVVHRLHLSTGRSLILKLGRGTPPRMYEMEADGLQALRVAGALRVPAVHRWGERFLLLEDLGAREAGPGYWEAFGHAVATQHTSCTSAQFGYAHDNYLGQLPQINTPTDDGHQFFAQHRLLRYLDEPLTQTTLTAADRARLERIAARLRDLIPAQPASLLHGDLWFANMLVGPDGEPAVVDPGVGYGWAEAELSMTMLCGRVPDEFFDAYREINPLQPGWRERFEILHLREHLSMIAHFGNRFGSADRLRDTLAKYG